MTTILLTCLLAAWPLAASAEVPSATAAAQERIAVSRTASVDASDPDLLWQRFKEQDRLLDDIHARLARIEGFIGDIQRLVGSTSNQDVTTPTEPAAVSTPAPTTAPEPAAQTPVRLKPARPPVPDFDDEDEEDSSFVSRWSMPLAAGAVLLLLLLLWVRKRGAAASAPKSGGKRK